MDWHETIDESSFDAAARDFRAVLFLGRPSGRAIRRTSSHRRTAISSSSPLALPR